jgi:hypothetical protein
MRTCARPGFEIDARSERTETEFDGGVEVRVTPKTFVGVKADRLRIDFDKAACSSTATSSSSSIR